MMEPGESATVAVRNKMGLLGGISYIVGNVVGAGIFITPATILANTHSVGFALALWVGAAAVAMLGAFSYIELGTRIRESGCDFAYYCYVRWYALAFCYMSVMSVVHYPAVMVVQSQTFSEYFFAEFNHSIEACIGGGGEGNRGAATLAVARKLTELALIVLLIFLNSFSLRRFVARFNIVATVAKILAASCIIGIGFYYMFFKGRTENFHQPFKGSEFKVKQVVSAMFASLFSYDGWDILNFGAEEIHHPRRNIPLSIIIGMAIICCIYVSINVAFFAVLSFPNFVGSSAIADTFIRETLGPSWSFLMPVMVCTLLVGSVNGTIFQSSRLLHSASRGGYLPAFVSCTQPETDSPRAALLITALLAFAMELVGDLHSLLNYIGFAQWSMYGLTMLVLFWIRYKGARVERERKRKVGDEEQAPVWVFSIASQDVNHPYEQKQRHQQRQQNMEPIRVPLAVPILFFAICATLAVLTIVEDTRSALLGLVVYFIALTIYAVFVYDKALPSLAAYRTGAGKLDSIITSLFQIGLDSMPQRMQMLSLDGENNPRSDAHRGGNEEKEEAAVLRPTSMALQPLPHGREFGLGSPERRGTQLWWCPSIKQEQGEERRNFGGGGGGGGGRLRKMSSTYQKRGVGIVEKAAYY